MTPEPKETTWHLHLAITPTEDGRFARINFRIAKPSTRVPTYLNQAGSIDLLYEKVQGDFNNLLRQIINEIHQQVVKPAQQQSKRR
jgi:hypothetical protein